MKCCAPTSRRWRSMPSSTPPTRRCSAAAAWTAPSTAPRGRDCVSRMPHARRLRHRRRQDHRRPTACRPSTSSTRSARSGAAAAADEDALLASCYWRSLELARDHGVTSIAFPSISTGIYGFPADRAAVIAVETVADFLEDEPGLLETGHLLLLRRQRRARCTRRRWPRASLEKGRNLLLGSWQGAGAAQDKRATPLRRALPVLLAVCLPRRRPGARGPRITLPDPLQLLEAADAAAGAGP